MAPLSYGDSRDSLGCRPTRSCPKAVSASVPPELETGRVCLPYPVTSCSLTLSLSSFEDAGVSRSAQAQFECFWQAVSPWSSPEESSKWTRRGALSGFQIRPRCSPSVFFLAPFTAAFCPHLRLCASDFCSLAPYDVTVRPRSRPLAPHTVLFFLSFLSVTDPGPYVTPVDATYPRTTGRNALQILVLGCAPPYASLTQRSLLVNKFLPITGIFCDLRERIPKSDLQAFLSSFVHCLLHPSSCSFWQVCFGKFYGLNAVFVLALPSAVLDTL